MRKDASEHSVVNSKAIANNVQGSGIIQPKMMVGQPHDAYEKEADEMAEKVTNTSKESASASSPSDAESNPDGSGSPLHGNNPENGGNNSSPPIFKKDISAEKQSFRSKIFRKQISNNSSLTDTVSPWVSSRINESKGSGSKMNETVRRKMETGFGNDFSDVNIHTGKQADTLNRSMNARAFTTGNDVYFRSGNYNPTSQDGQKLLAHELTHVVQQKGMSDTIQHKKEKSGIEEYVIPTNDATELKNIGSACIKTWPALKNFVVINKGRAAFYNKSSKLINSYRLTGLFRPSNGIYMAGSDGIFKIGKKGNSKVVFEIDEEGLDEKVLKQLEDKQMLYLSDWINITDSFQPEIPIAMIVAPIIKNDSDEEEGGTPGEAGYGTEFAGEGKDGKPYDFPALPAKIKGLPQQPTGGTGIFSMHLDYNYAAPDLLGQVSTAFHGVGHHWEVWDITKSPNVQKRVEEVKTGGVSKNKKVDRFDHTGGDVDRTWDKMADRPNQIAEDKKEAWEEERYWDVVANEINEGLIGLEYTMAIGSELLGIAADVFTPDEERSVHWPKKGIYVVRCIASIASYDEEKRRAPSVAAMAVVVDDVEKLSQEAIDQPGAQLEELRLQLALLEKLPEGDPNKYKIDGLKETLKEKEILVEGSPEEIIKYNLKKKEAELKRKREKSIFIKNGMHDSEVYYLEKEVDELKDQLSLAQSRKKDIESLSGGSSLRADGVLISNITGQSYPLLLQIGEPYKNDGSWVCRLSDVTSRDGNRYEGSVTDNPFKIDKSQKLKAVTEALEEFAGDAGYGEGSLTIRLPDEGWFAGIDKDKRTITLKSRPRDWASAKQRLEELGQVIAILGLVITSPALGLAGGALAIALAGERLAKRVSNGTFRWDAQAIGDIIDILSSAVSFVNIGFIGALKVIPEKGGITIQILRTGAKVGAKATDVAEEVLDVMGIIHCNVTTADEIAKVNKAVADGKMTKTEGRRQKASLMAGAIQSNAMTFVSKAKAAGEKQNQTGDDTPDAEHVKDNETPAKTVDTDTSVPAPPKKGRSAEDMAKIKEAMGDFADSVDIVENGDIGNAVHVKYDEGKLVLEIGPGADAWRVGHHVDTMKQLQKYIGVVGMIRQLISRIAAKVGLGDEFGTKGFESKLEKVKLQRILDDLQSMQSKIDERAKQLSESDQGELSKAKALQDEIDSEIEAIKQQLDRHMRFLGSDEAGSGRIAVEDTQKKAKQVEEGDPTQQKSDADHAHAPPEPDIDTTLSKEQFVAKRDQLTQDLKTQFKGDESVDVLLGILKKIRTVPKSSIAPPMEFSGNQFKQLKAYMEAIISAGNPEYIETLKDIVNPWSNISVSDAIGAVKYALEGGQIYGKKLTKLQEDIASYRSQHVGNKKEAGKVTGGTVAAGSLKIKGNDIEMRETGGSSNAQGNNAVHNTRYEAPSEVTSARDHAEQNVLGNIADRLDQLIKDGQLSGKDIQGELNMHVDQAVCTTCRQGLKSDKKAGVIKQFSKEYPKITIIITADETNEVLIIKGGKQI